MSSPHPEPISEKRLKLMQSGASMVIEWMNYLGERDLTILEKDPSILENWAAQLVNYKWGSAAQRVRSLAEDIEQGDWLPQARHLIYRLQLAALGLTHYHDQPRLRQYDLAQFAGVQVKKEAVLQHPGRGATWITVGRQERTMERIQQYQTWLYNANLGFRKIIDHVFGRQRPRLHPLGTIFKGEVHDYPSQFPIRTIPGTWHFKGKLKKANWSEPWTSWHKLRKEMIRIMNLQPWVDEIPFFVRPRAIDQKNDQCLLVDDEGSVMAFHPGSWSPNLLGGACVDGGLHLWMVWSPKHFELIGVYAYDQYFMP